MTNSPKTCDQLIDALAYRHRQRPVVFVVGSGLTTPTKETRGVPGAKDMVGRLATLLREHNSELANQFHAQFTEAADYKGAFGFLQKHEFPNDPIDANVRAAVLNAYTDADAKSDLARKAIAGNVDACIETEFDADNWAVRPGLAAFAEIVSKLPKVFGKDVLTTNFDPLIEVAIRQLGGSPVSIRVSEDGGLQTLDAWGRIIHVHGYWHGPATMLHTGSQLSMSREKLEYSVVDVLTESEVCVVGYGGWDDILVRTLSKMASNHAVHKIHWCFFDSPPTQPSNELKALFNHNNVVPYQGVDADSFLPRLRDRLAELDYFAVQANSRHSELEKERDSLKERLSQQEKELHAARSQETGLKEVLTRLDRVEKGINVQFSSADLSRLVRTALQDHLHDLLTKATGVLPEAKVDGQSVSGTQLGELLNRVLDEAAKRVIDGLKAQPRGLPGNIRVLIVCTLMAIAAAGVAWKFGFIG